MNHNGHFRNSKSILLELFSDKQGFALFSLWNLLILFHLYFQLKIRPNFLISCCKRFLSVNISKTCPCNMILMCKLSRQLVSGTTMVVLYSSFFHCWVSINEIIWRRKCHQVHCCSIQYSASVGSLINIFMWNSQFYSSIVQRKVLRSVLIACLQYCLAICNVTCTFNNKHGMVVRVVFCKFYCVSTKHLTFV